MHLTRPANLTGESKVQKILFKLLGEHHEKVCCNTNTCACLIDGLDCLRTGNHPN